MPRRWKLIETVREKFVCRVCQTITQPPSPFHATPNGFIGPRLLATILFDKFGQHVPLNRQSDRFRCEGIDLSISTLADQVGAGRVCHRFTLETLSPMTAQQCTPPQGDHRRRRITSLPEQTSIMASTELVQSFRKGTSYKLPAAEILDWHKGDELSGRTATSNRGMILDEERTAIESVLQRISGKSWTKFFRLEGEAELATRLNAVRSALREAG